jgi:large subunit ribosomal protein L15
VRIKGFEGGQMPLHRRLPKRGFKNLFRVEYQIINVGRIQAAIDSGRLDAGAAITAATLHAAGLVRDAVAPTRLLGHGELKAKLTIELAAATPSAVQAVEAAGGKVSLPGVAEGGAS